MGILDEGLPRSPDGTVDYNRAVGILGKLGQTWPARLARGLLEAAAAPGNAVMNPGSVPYPGMRREDYTDIPAQGHEGWRRVFGSVGSQPIDNSIGQMTDLASALMSGTFASTPAGAMGAGPVMKPPKVVKSYHATFSEPFERFDFARLGESTYPNVSGIGSVEEYALNLARLGPWSSSVPVASKMGAPTVLQVELSGKSKSFTSLDALESAIRKAGGPEKMREQLVRDGFDYVKVKDGEFGGDSFVALTSEAAKITKPNER